MSDRPDIYHFRPKDLLSFWGISRATMLRSEGDTFKAMPRDKNGDRYLSLFEACEVYNGIWKRYPTQSQVAEWLLSLDFDQTETKIAVLRLESKGLVRTGLS